MNDRYSLRQSASGGLPQVAEFYTPRSMDAAEKCLAYDGFKACKLPLVSRMFHMCNFTFCFDL